MVILEKMLKENEQNKIIMWMISLTFQVLYPFCDYSLDKNPLSKSYFLFLLSSTECFFQNSSSLTFGAFSPQLQLFIVKTFRFNSMLLSSSHRSLFVLREVFSALTSLYTFIIYNKNKKKRQVVKLALKLVKLVISSISFAFFLQKQESEPCL